MKRACHLLKERHRDMGRVDVREDEEVGLAVQCTVGHRPLSDDFVECVFTGHLAVDDEVRRGKAQSFQRFAHALGGFGLA